MKTLNSLSMGFILSTLVLTACESDGKDSYQTQRKIQIATECTSPSAQLFSFIVSARDWRKLSVTELFVEVPVPAINDSIIKEGTVMIYLNEAGKNLSLPFTYYQIRHAMSFQPSYKEGRVYVNVLGNFILNTRAFYTFKVLVINPEGLKKFETLNWYNFDEAKQVLNLKQDQNS